MLQWRPATCVCLLLELTFGVFCADHTRTWEIAYRALCDPETASNSEALQSFLTAKESVEVLSRPWQPFPEPSTQEKNKFDTKTAPINVASASTSDYNIDEIKEDSLWLSSEAKISQYAALQLVVHEWQGRSSTQLLSGLTEEEALSVQEAAGIPNLGVSTFIPGASILAIPPAAHRAQFDSQDQRRLRIIDLYHSSCASILRISQLLVSWGSASNLRTQNTYYDDYIKLGTGWIEELGRTITVAQNGNGTLNTGAKALDDCLEAVRARCGALEEGYRWNVAESILESASARWVTAQTTELLHLLHLSLVHADLVVEGFVPAATIQEWLTTLLMRGFFREFPVVSGCTPIMRVVNC